jgi:hypothetical protein
MRKNKVYSPRFKWLMDCGIWTITQSSNPSIDQQWGLQWKNDFTKLRKITNVNGASVGARKLSRTTKSD